MKNICSSKDTIKSKRTSYKLGEKWGFLKEQTIYEWMGVEGTGGTMDVAEGFGLSTWKTDRKTGEESKFWWKNQEFGLNVQDAH